ncbi:MAG TPA: phospho-sugar mutase [Holophagaceae bacterium]|nr:phospho-sugar mutase [Holophagaceae bacterium]
MSLQAAHDYLSAPHLEADLRAELEPLVKVAEDGDAAAIAELDDRFSEPLAFGTGGLRGLMGAGLKRMNAVNVRRATMALAGVTQRRAPGKKIALVGYDTRLNSAAYGLEAARTLVVAGYEVYLGTRPLPTPFLCFAMRELGAACGVILTASHNPKAYNGYKAYDDRGAQLVAPWDAEVEAAMAALPLVPEPPKADETRIKPIPTEVEAAYTKLALSLLRHPQPFTAAKLLYTPFHGTGGAFVPDFFHAAGLPLESAKAQSVQDGNFPTAPRPNPEEIAAYGATLDEAAQLGTEVILSNDPDADRIGVVAKRSGKGDWELMSGNDLAALTLDYLCRFGGLEGVVISTVVTSDFLAEVAKSHGLQVMWTLTGFKNIAACMDRLVETGETYAFGAEESFGMLLSDRLRDKDGVATSLVIGEMLGHYKALGMGPFEAVRYLQKQVGVFHNRLVNLEDPRPGGAQRFAEAMARIRRAGLTSLGGETVEAWEDFQSGEFHGRGVVEPILDRPDRRDVAQEIHRSNVLKFRLASGAFAAFRPSGTEPKLKVYLQSRTDEALLDRLEAEARALLGL